MEWVHSILLVHILRYADAKNDPSITITLYIGIVYPFVYKIFGILLGIFCQSV